MLLILLNMNIISIVWKYMTGIPMYMARNNYYDYYYYYEFAKYKIDIRKTWETTTDIMKTNESKSNFQPFSGTMGKTWVVPKLLPAKSMSSQLKSALIFPLKSTHQISHLSMHVFRVHVPRTFILSIKIHLHRKIHFSNWVNKFSVKAKKKKTHGFPQILKSNFWMWNART